MMKILSKTIMAAITLSLNFLTTQAQEPVFTPTPHPLIEEGTGTGCGWCTRGWVGMTEIQKRYPNAVVAVWHMDDPMAITSTFPFKYGSGIPGCAINRTINAIDPFYGSHSPEEMGIVKDYAEALKTPAVADIEATATWNAAHDSVLVTANLHFAQMAPKCKVGYMMLAGGYCHAGQDDEAAWTQSNYYGDTYDEGLLKILCEMPRKNPNFVFDDVVIYAKELRGVVGSLPDTVQPDQRVSHQYAIPAKSITSKDGTELLEKRNNLNLQVIVYLLNRINRVTNALKVPVKESTPTGLNLTDAEEPSVVGTTYYDLNGRVSNALDRGLYIRVETLSNGSSRSSKVVR